MVWSDRSSHPSLSVTPPISCSSEWRTPEAWEIVAPTGSFVLGCGPSEESAKTDSISEELCSPTAYAKPIADSYRNRLRWQSRLVADLKSCWASSWDVGLKRLAVSPPYQNSAALSASNYLLEWIHFAFEKLDLVGNTSADHYQSTCNLVALIPS